MLLRAFGKEQMHFLVCCHPNLRTALTLGFLPNLFLPTRQQLANKAQTICPQRNQLQSQLRLQFRIPKREKS